MTVNNNLWLRRLKPQPQAQRRLFCFHFAGGSASLYRTWPAVLAPRLPDVELCAVQLPGRENRLREAPFTQVEPLITALLDALGPELDRPFALFGHSMGAIIAYELAQTLKRNGGPQPSQLLISGRRSPTLPDPLPPLHHLPTDEMLQAIGRRYGNLPAVLLQDAELKAIYAPLLQADFSIVENYQPSTLEPLPCPLSVFGGVADPIATAAELAAWRPLTQSHFALQLFPGGHFYLQEESGPLLEQIAVTLSVNGGYPAQ